MPKTSKFLLEIDIPIAKIPPHVKDPDLELAPILAKRLGISASSITEYEIIKRSLDARKKPKLIYRYRVNVTLKNRTPINKKRYGIKIGQAVTQTTYSVPENSRLAKHPVIVGTGPAGLLAAWVLAENGSEPIVIDRGQDVETRHRDINEFLSKRQLNPESNFLFGEGGAGTYSDGKLYTRSKDPRCAYILDLLVACGAPAEITYLQRPHIGSDRLPDVIHNLRKKILARGGRFLWGKHVTDVISEDGQCTGITLSDGETIHAPLTILATGHSDRQLIQTLINHNVDSQLKDFQVGCRIEHSQTFINRIQYGRDQFPPYLGSADYHIVYRPDSRDANGAASFCMCPGGILIPATNQEKQLSTNGMSNYQRDSEFANAALIVKQAATDFDTPDAAFNLLNQLETALFELGGSDYTCPAQGAYAFVNKTDSLPHANSSYLLGICPARLDQLLPNQTTATLTEALKHFESVMPGYMTSGILVGIETHISSPIRFNRDANTLSSSLKNLYIAGEGAGYASGIMSSAIDGMRIAEAIIQHP